MLFGLLGAVAGPPPPLPAPVRGAESASGQAITPETYLGYQRIDRYAGSKIEPDRAAAYRFPRAPLPQNHLALDGGWRVEDERSIAGLGARLRLDFHARDVHLVLGGRGEVEVWLEGARRKTVRVRGDRLYTLLRLPDVRDGVLELRFSPGVEAYAFTFG